MGGICACLFCCECQICEPRDDWNIENEAREGERGAGWLYKKAKGSDLVWSKRYFVISNEKLMYFTDRDRLVMKGEIILAGALADQSTTRPDTKKCFYFTVSHPQCGTREFYAKTRNRRNQWMAKINDISNELSARTVSGKLYKQGGLGKNVWQERWCICTGSSLDYFDSPTDNQSKGSLPVIGATVKAVNIKEKFCFELSAAQPGKKGNKKYVFGTDKEHERDAWVEMLSKASTNAFHLPPPPLAQSSSNVSTDSTNSANVSSNPLHAAALANAASGSVDGDEDNSGISLQHMSVSSNRSSASQATELSGYLLKKSPNVMKGWQKRYFKTLSNGDLSYYKSEQDSKVENSEEKGAIRLKDIVMPHGVELNESTFEITIKLYTKKVHLKAKDLDEAVEWVRNIEAWIQRRFTNASID